MQIFNFNFTKISILTQFNEFLPNELNQSISLNEHMAELSVKLNHLIHELARFAAYSQTSFTPERVFIYKGHFARLSIILALINNAANVINLKSVRIHMSNALLIDTNFVINTQRYTTHSPDLIVVAPRVKFNQASSIDLSCYLQQPYPNGGQAKAASGSGYGGAGHDGLPGLPGCNGGQFVLFGGEIVNEDKLTFRAKGGMGGPGQNGMK
jgi:hypothetical protein